MDNSLPPVASNATQMLNSDTRYMGCFDCDLLETITCAALYAIGVWLLFLTCAAEVAFVYSVVLLAVGLGTRWFFFSDHYHAVTLRSYIWIPFITTTHPRPQSIIVGSYAPTYYSGGGLPGSPGVSTHVGIGSHVQVGGDGGLPGMPAAPAAIPAMPVSSITHTYGGGSSSRFSSTSSRSSHVHVGEERGNLPGMPTAPAVVPAAMSTSSIVPTYGGVGSGSRFSSTSSRSSRVRRDDDLPEMSTTTRTYGANNSGSTRHTHVGGGSGLPGAPAPAQSNRRHTQVGQTKNGLPGAPRG